MNAGAQVPEAGRGPNVEGRMAGAPRSGRQCVGSWPMKSFASDNYAAAHPDVLAALAEANDGHAISYGADPWTARAEAVLREHFGAQSQALLVFNGSGANVLALRCACRPWEAVIC